MDVISSTIAIWVKTHHIIEKGAPLAEGPLNNSGINQLVLD
tara:strand:- start:28 stop:150 length:123 start_codon:yes stop_codon:yes gene_type:complete